MLVPIAFYFDKNCIDKIIIILTRGQLNTPSVQNRKVSKVRSESSIRMSYVTNLFHVLFIIFFF